MATSTKIVYNIDTSALLTLESFYPQDMFPQVWERIDQLFVEGRAYIIEEVYKEIEKKDDAVFRWLKQRKGYVVKKQEQDAWIKAQEILAKHPNLVDVNATQTSADPFVIADSIISGSVVVTREDKVNTQPNTRKLKIPNVCDSYQVACIYGQYFAIDFFRENNWEFLNLS